MSDSDALREKREQLSTNISDNCLASSNASFSAYCRSCSAERSDVNFSSPCNPQPDTGPMVKDIARAVSILQEYYEGSPLFYSVTPRAPKIFQPVLLYHSYSDKVDSAFDDKTHNMLNTADSKDDVQTRDQQAECVDDVTENPNRARTFHIIRDEMIHQTHTKRADYDSRLTIVGSPLKQTHESSTEIPNCSQNECNFPKVNDAFTKSRSSLHSASDIKQDLGSNSYRSAFTKPKRYSAADLNISNKCSQRYLYSNSVDLTGTPWKDESSESRVYYSCVSCPQRHSVNLSDSFSVNIALPDQASFHTYDTSDCLQTFRYSTFGSYNEISPNLEKHSFHHSSTRISESLMIPQSCQNCILGQSGIALPICHDHFAFNCPTLSGCQNTGGDNNSDQQELPYQLCQSLHPSTLTFKNHTKGHSAAGKSHKCECGRAFARNEELARHKRIHSGLRPFRCSLCEKTFGRKDHLNKHKITHLKDTEKKVHACDVNGCLQRYTRSDALARHQMAVHGIRARLTKWRAFY